MGHMWSFSTENSLPTSLTRHPSVKVIFLGPEGGLNRGILMLHDALLHFLIK